MIRNQFKAFHRLFTFSPFRGRRSPIAYSILTLLTALLCSLLTPAFAIPSTSASTLTAQITPSLEQGKSLYESGNFAEAAAVLHQAAAAARSQNDPLTEAIALSNLSLVQQQLGNWTEATQAIEQAISLLQAIPDRDAVLAQALEVQGRLQFSRGDAEAALNTWKQAGTYYDRLRDPNGVIRSRINQAQALQALGMYRRAITTLEQLVNSFSAQPPTAAQVVALRSLGDALRVAGTLDQSTPVLIRSLTLAQQLNLPQQIAATQLSLGNAYTSQDISKALEFYQQVINGSGTAMTQIQAQLNRLKLLIDAQQKQSSPPEIAAQISSIPTLVSEATAQIDRLPPSRPAIYARINLAHNLTTWKDLDQQEEIIPQLLATAAQQAQSLQDVRAESFAQGNLGNLYEQRGQWIEAQQVTTTALNLAKQISADDMTYRWQWQLGRVLNQQQQREPAIAAYAEAIDTLRLLRSDLTATNPDVQFSFRESVEPVYRQFVGLLLQPYVESTQTDLEQARKTIESLQLAELDNFFRTACLNAQEQQIDEIDRKAAVLYPIILDDRLEVILSLPGGQLRRYTALDAGQSQVESRAIALAAFLKQLTANDRVLPLAQQFYDWLIRPAEVDLENSGVETLVFVLDGVLRNIPMAVLHDGIEYLIEKPYSLALTPGLQLLESQPLEPRRLNVLLGGLSEARPPNFPPLNNVTSEFDGIQSEVRESQELLNDRFTTEEIQQAIGAVPYPVVHLATHGVFDSDREKTFILTWNGELDIDQLRSLLQATEVGRQRPIELLVLSACETAEGDDRAALGLAGVAVRAGARSTVATLWQVNDEAMSLLMKQFYQELVKPNVTKAEALRQAQRAILKDANNPDYAQPYYWSPVVLIGNWQS
ncbi:CHAT domain-containing protein [Phormidium tenue FACHB-886]|nr:CHAT domain-containing protein [Phormidium tenue FACHB-886]